MSFILTYLDRTSYDYSQLNVLDKAIKLALQQDIQFINENIDEIFKIINIKLDLDATLKIAFDLC